MGLGTRITTAVISGIAAIFVTAGALDARTMIDEQLDHQRFANGIAAVVEDRIITVDEVRREISLLVDQVRTESRTEAEFNQKLRELEREVIQSLVDRLLMIKAFEKDEKLRIPQTFIDAQMSDILMNDFDGDRGRFLEQLQAEGKTIRDFRRDLREQIMVDYMRGRMRRSQAIVSPVRIENFYEENKDRFFEEAAIHLRLIQLSPLADESTDVLKQTADRIMAELEEGASFGDLARRHSQDRRRTDGGDWGWINLSDLREDWAEIAEELSAGEFSEPMLSQDGSIYILYAEDKRQAGIQPLAEVREQIERILVSRMATEAQERWLERLRRDAFVKFF